MTEIHIEKWLTFTLIDGKWDIQLWVDSAKPINAKVYRLTVRVPDELIGEVEAIASDKKQKNGDDDDKHQYH